jgi:glycosyltransferase 2 family protein
MYLSFRDVDLKNLLNEIAKTKYVYVILGSIVGAYIGSYIRAYRWQLLLNPLKEKINIHSLFSAVMIGYLMNIFIPRAGELSRPILIAQKENISKAAAIGTVVVERLMDMLTMFIVFGLCLFYYRDRISNAFGEYNIEAISLYSSLIILAFVGLAIIMLFNIEKTEKIIEKITKKFLPENIYSKIHKIIISLVNGFLFIKYPKLYLRIFISSALLWIAYVMSMFIMFYAYDDITSKHLNFFDANLVLTMQSFAMTIPLPGNSAGTFHFFVKTALAGFFLVDTNTALSFATVDHLSGLVFLIVIGTYFYMKENININKLKNQNNIQ